MTQAIDLGDKTIVITGGLGAIAESILKTLSAYGAHLIVTDLQSVDEARPILERWSLDTLPYYCMNVCDPEEVQRVLTRIFDEHHAINVALGHAGGTKIYPFAQCERETFDQIVQFNLMGQTYFAREVLTHWTRAGIPGHLIFTSSYVSRFPMEGISAYVMSKAGLEMFAKNIALEYAPHGIRVNCIAPGNVAAGSSKLMYETNETYRAWVDRVSPMGRNSPESIANAFVYLCSELGHELDGHVLTVDQGVSLPKLG